MNKIGFLPAIYSFNAVVNSGKEEKIYRCAYSLDGLCKSESPYPFMDYESAWIRFIIAEAMIASSEAVEDEMDNVNSEKGFWISATA